MLYLLWGIRSLVQFLLLPSPCPHLLKFRKGEEILRGGSAHQHQHLVDTWKFICCLAGAQAMGQLQKKETQKLDKNTYAEVRWDHPPIFGLNMVAEHG